MTPHAATAPIRPGGRGNGPAASPAAATTPLDALGLVAGLPSGEGSGSEDSSVTTYGQPLTRVRRWGAVAVATASLIVLGACGSDAKPGDARKPANATDHTVAMKLIVFAPDSLEVAAGSTVTWRQDDAGFHTVTSGTVDQGAAGVTPQADSTFDSGQIPKGDSFEFTFDRPGSFPYFCAIHPATMRGEIRVR